MTVETEASSDLLVRVDRVLTRKYYDNPVARVADAREGRAGELFLTGDGVVGFLAVKAQGPDWAVPLSDISEVREARNYGSPVPLPPSGTVFRARFGKVTRTVAFTGMLPGARLNVVDNVMGRLPTHHTAGIGKMYVFARLEYMQRVTLPRVEGAPSSPTRRAREAREWWLALLRAPADEMEPDDSLPPERQAGVMPAHLTPLHVQGLTKSGLEVLPLLMVRLPQDEPVLKVFAVFIRARHNWKHASLIALGPGTFTVFGDRAQTNSRFIDVQGPYDSIISVTTRKNALFWRAVDLTIRTNDGIKTLEMVDNSWDHNEAMVASLRERLATGDGVATWK